jgi:catalase
MWSRIAVAPLVLFLALPCFAADQAAPPAQQSLPLQLVDDFAELNGNQPGVRVNHAKGVVVEGTFMPSASAETVSTAEHFQHQLRPIPVTIRFSDGSGMPAVPDTNTIPRGMAIKFTLPNGAKTDIVALSYNGFPAATAAEFHEFLRAIAVSGPNAHKPTPLDTFLDAHPAAKAFVTTPKPPPVSFGTLAYYGINTFKFTNAKGAVTYGRYQILPVAGTQVLTPKQLAKMGPDYLINEIGQRLRKGPVKFALFLQVADPGDKLDDPSVAWPVSRKTIPLGTITITTSTKESHTADTLLFLPGAVTTGIEPADPMIDVRSAAYPISFARRLKPQ